MMNSNNCSYIIFVNKEYYMEDLYIQFELIPCIYSIKTSKLENSRC